MKKSGPIKKGGMRGGGMAKKKTGMRGGGMMPAKKKAGMRGGGMTKKKTGMMGGGMAKKSGPMKKKTMMKKGGMAKKAGPMKKKVMKKGGMAKKAGPKKGMRDGGSTQSIITLAIRTFCRCIALGRLTKGWYGGQFLSAFLIRTA